MLCTALPAACGRVSAPPPFRPLWGPASSHVCLQSQGVFQQPLWRSQYLTTKLLAGHSHFDLPQPLGPSPLPFQPETLARGGPGKSQALPKPALTTAPPAPSRGCSPAHRPPPPPSFSPALPGTALLLQSHIQKQSPRASCVLGTALRLRLRARGQHLSPLEPAGRRSGQTPVSGPRRSTAGS